MLCELEDPFAEGQDRGEFFAEHGEPADPSLPVDHDVHQVVAAVRRREIPAGGTAPSSVLAKRVESVVTWGPQMR